MRKFDAAEIRFFLLSFDQRLTKPFYFEVIGSAAAMLAFGMDKDTRDFDTTVSISAIAEPWEDTSKETGLYLPLDQVHVHQPPYEYESRLRRLRIPELKHLQIFVPEKHDWALLKIARLHDKDLEHILDVAARIGFSRKIFLERFINEMWIAHGNKKDLIYNFLVAMEKLFGKKVADQMKVTIEADQRWM